MHDLRRTMRTGLGAISSITLDIREKVIAHIPPKIQRIYDVHAYRDEKRQALTQWAARVVRIVEPVPQGEKVVDLHHHRAAEAPGAA